MISLTKTNVRRHPIYTKIQEWLKDEVPLKDIVEWCRTDGYKISTTTLTKLKKELFKKVVDQVKEKSVKLVDELATDRLNLADSIEDSIKAINEILENTSLDECTPKNAREYATLVQAKANLTRAELEARGEAPKRNLEIMKLIQKSKKKEEEGVKKNV